MGQVGFDTGEESGGAELESAVPGLPEGWVWVGEWQLDRSGNVDREGWAHGKKQSDLTWPPASPQARRFKGVIHTLRRRRWVRAREFRPTECYEGRVELFVLGPGASRAVPSGFLRADAPDLCIQIRPAGELKVGLGASRSLGGKEEREDSRYGWGEAVPLRDGRQLFMGKQLVETEQFLWCPSGGGRPMWLQMSASASVIGYDGDGEAIRDWKVSVQPPLVLHNCLPLGSTFQVWDRQTAAAAEACASGLLRPGEKVGLTSVDPRRGAYLGWTAGEEWQGPAEPVVLIHPYVTPAGSLLLTKGKR